MLYFTYPGFKWKLKLEGREWINMVNKLNKPHLPIDLIYWDSSEITIKILFYLFPDFELLIQIFKLTSTSFFKILGYVHPVCITFFHLFWYTELPSWIIVFYRSFHNHYAYKINTGVKERMYISGQGYLQTKCVQALDENLTELFKQNSSESEARTEKTYLTALKSHFNVTLLLLIYLFSPPPIRAHKESAIPLFKKNDKPPHHWPKQNQLQRFQLSTEATSDQGTLQYSMQPTTQVKVVPHLPGACWANLSQTGQDPSTASPRGTACGSALQGPTRQAQSRSAPEAGSHPTPGRPTRPCSRLHRARKQGQDCCRARGWARRVRVVAPVTSVKARALAGSGHSGARGSYLKRGRRAGAAGWPDVPRVHHTRGGLKPSEPEKREYQWLHTGGPYPLLPWPTAPPRTFQTTEKTTPP